MGLRNSLAAKVGKGKYAMAEYEKIKRISIPLDADHQVTTEVAADHVDIINSILDQLRK
jgi:hypothetical protein